MTDKKEPRGVTEAGRRLPGWMLLAIAAIAIAAYGFFLIKSF